MPKIALPKSFSRFSKKEENNIASDYSSYFSKEKNSIKFNLFIIKSLKKFTRKKQYFTLLRVNDKLRRKDIKNIADE